MRKILTIILSAFAAILLASCNKNTASFEDEITLDFVFEEFSEQTKSSVVLNDSEINNAVILIYDEDGKIVGSPLDWNHTPLKVTLNRRENYWFCAICNVASGSFVAPATLSALGEAKVSHSFSGNRVVMAGRTELIQVKKGMNPLIFNVERVASRMAVKLNKSALPVTVSFQVKSVKIKNANAQSRPFDAGFKAAVVADGDQLSSSDVSTFNGGVETYLYIPENMQGTVSGITTAAGKVPDNMPSGMADKSTYVEIVASVKPDTDFDNASDVIYRFYLGKNATNNFDIERNRAFKVTFKPKNNFYNQSTWKMESPFIATDPDSPVIIDPDEGDTEIEIEY